MSTAESIPIVSVVMPTYNRRATILRAIDSVRAQYELRLRGVQGGPENIRCGVTVQH